MCDVELCVTGIWLRIGSNMEEESIKQNLNDGVKQRYSKAQVFRGIFLAHVSQKSKYLVQ